MEDEIFFAKMLGFALLLLGACARAPDAERSAVKSETREAGRCFRVFLGFAESGQTERFEVTAPGSRCFDIAPGFRDPGATMAASKDERGTLALQPGRSCP